MPGGQSSGAIAFVGAAKPGRAQSRHQSSQILQMAKYARLRKTLAKYTGKIAPGFAKLLNYQRRDLLHDLVAGLSVAAVALPVGVAYAQLTGFHPVVGL